LRVVDTEEAANILRGGGDVLAPTETVVGLLAGEDGLSRVKEIKGRDADKPVALLCETPEAAFALAASVPPLARKLADRFWPGALTLVLDSPDGGTVGVRVPAECAARAVLVAYGDPLYATSANPSGEPAPASLDEVDPRVLEAVDAVVEGEPGGGEASAVVDVSGGRVRVLRPTEQLTEERLASWNRRSDERRWG
jgi:L-threonylcarbamoyladenylate synthase